MLGKLKILNNPFETVLEATRQLFPDKSAFVIFDPDLKYRKFLWIKLGHCGETLFPDDGSVPIVRVSSQIPFEAMIEVLAHELAHVAVGVGNGHNSIWKRAFDDIHSCYEEIMESKIDHYYDYGLMKPKGGR